jgi:hypothetical protein
MKKLGKPEQSISKKPLFMGSPDIINSLPMPEVEKYLLMKIEKIILF